MEQFDTDSLMEQLTELFRSGQIDKAAYLAAAHEIAKLVEERES